MTRRRAWTVTLVLSTAATLVLAARVLADPATQLFGYELVGRHHDPFTVLEQYAAGGVPRPYFQPLTDLSGIALSRLTSPLAAYNTLVLVTFPLSAIAAYAHARHLVGSPSAALVAALLFMLAPFHLAHAAYHVHIAQVQWLPLSFLAMWRLVERPSLVRGATFAAALFVTALASLYLGFVVAIVAPVAVLSYVWFARSALATSPRVAATWGALTLATTATAAILAIGIWLPEVLRNPSAFAFPDEALDQHSARWWSYLLPPAGHPLLGGFSTAVWRGGGIDTGLLEQQVSLGLSVLVLAAIPVVWRSPAPHGALTQGRARALAITALAAAFCSLPPTVHIGPLTLPTPAALVHQVAPMFRAYARFGAVVVLMVTTLAGVGAALLLSRRTRAATGIAMGLMALAAFEYFPPLPSARDVLPTSGHRWLERQPVSRLFDCTTPAPGATAGVRLLMRADVSFKVSPLDDCGDPELAGKLAAFGFSHLLVRHQSDVGGWLVNGGAIDGLRPLHVGVDASVFEVAASTPAVYTAATTGLYPREFRSRDSWRWLGPAGSITAVNATSETRVVSLRLELESFATARRIRIVVDDRDFDTVLVPVQRGEVTIGPLRFAPGPHLITFEADSTATPATLTPPSADARRLSVRFFRWRWQTIAD